jgi:hypothetical protein
MATAARTRVVAIVVIAVLLLGLVGITVVRAQDVPQLHPVGVDDLVASTLTALERPVSISGDVETRLDLGLPEVPASLGGEGGPIAMIGGTQRFRVWQSTDGLRVAHILEVSEQDLIVDPHEAWWWDAADLTATHISRDAIGSPLLAGPIAGSLAGDRGGPWAAMAADPLNAARAALHSVAPFANVEVEGTTVVAGRDAYELAMVPTSSRTLVGRVVIAIDARRRLPLRVQVFPRTAQTDALSVGFTSVSFDAIDPAMFTFAPPPGATVTDGLADHATPGEASDERSPSGGDGGPTPLVLGSGFETRVAIPVSQGLPAEVQQLLPYAGPLVSAVFTSTSTGAWLLVGSVPVDMLQHDAGRLP